MDASDPFSQGKEVLSQTEVEQLLAQITEQQASTIIHKSDGEKKQQPKEAIQPYDFRNPVYLTAGELRKLRIQHEEYIRALAARLSIHLRVEFTVQMSKLQTLTFQKFTEGLANPTHLTLFKIPPLDGTCVLDIAPRLGLTIVDRLLGGPGHSVNLNRDLSEIEVALLDQAVGIVIGEWCRHWSDLQDLRHVQLGHETNGQFLPSAQPDAIMLVLSMEVRMGDCMEVMQLAFPYQMIEPLVRKLGEQMSPEAPGATPQHPLRPPVWNPRLADVHMSVKADWPPLSMKARDLSQLHVGDWVPVPAEFMTQVRLRLEGTPRFMGRLGTVGSRWAIELTRILKPEV